MKDKKVAVLVIAALLIGAFIGFSVFEAVKFILG